MVLPANFMSPVFPDKRQEFAFSVHRFLQTETCSKAVWCQRISVAWTTFPLIAIAFVLINGSYANGLRFCRLKGRIGAHLTPAVFEHRVPQRHIAMSEATDSSSN